jgi:ribosomal protein L32
LLLLSDIPGAQVQSAIKPGDAPGTSDLVVDVTSAPRYTGTLTVPCVVQLAYMRQKMIHKSKVTVCEPCGAFMARHARFCPSCGQATGVTA